MIRCNKCSERKAEYLFPINKKCASGRSGICKKCENHRQSVHREIARNWVYPYSKVNTLNCPIYINDRKAIEMEHGHGWWCNDGRGWEMRAETVGERNKRYQEAKNG